MYTVYIIHKIICINYVLCYVYINRLFCFDFSEPSLFQRAPSLGARTPVISAPHHKIQSLIFLAVVRGSWHDMTPCYILKSSVLIGQLRPPNKAFQISGHNCSSLMLSWWNKTQTEAGLSGLSYSKVLWPMSGMLKCLLVDTWWYELANQVQVAKRWRITGQPGTITSQPSAFNSTVLGDLLPHGICSEVHQIHLDDVIWLFHLPWFQTD